VLEVFIFLSGFIKSKPIKPKKYLVLAAVSMSLFLLTLTITTQISTSAMAISLQYTAPMYLIAYNFIKYKNIKKKNILVFTFIFIGVIVNILRIFRDRNYLAILTGLAIGLSFVCYSQFLQKVEEGNPLGIVSIINLICCGLYALALLFNFGNPPTKISDIILIVLAGIFNFRTFLCSLLLGAKKGQVREGSYNCTCRTNSKSNLGLAL